MDRTKAEAIVTKILAEIGHRVDWFIVCGSYRREKPNPGDIDIVLIPKAPYTLPEILPANEGINWLGDKKAQVIVDGEKVDFKVTTPEGKGAAILYFTGSAGYNIGLRIRAKKMGMKLNEYGIWDRETNEYLGGKTEEEIYEVLGKKFKEPRDRK